MNIAIDVRPLQTSVRTGVGEYAYELLSAVFSLYPEHRYFLCSSGMKSFEIPAKWQKDNIIPLHLKWPNKIINASILIANWPRVSDWPKLNNKEIKFDYIYYPNLSSIGVEVDVPTILTVHDITFSLFPQFLSLHRRLWHAAIKPKKLIKGATKITTPSQVTAADVAGEFKINSEKISVITPGQCTDWVKPNIEDLERVKKVYNLPEKFILYLGTIEPRKNIIGLVRAFGAWQKKSNNDAKLVIAGAPGWKNKNIFQLIKNTPNVEYVGYVKDADKPALYSLARIFAYPSFYEGFGLPVLEAFMSGVPVLTSNRSALTEVAGTAAYLVDPNNQSDIAQGLERLWNDESARKYYIEKGREQANKFLWEQSAKKFMDIICHSGESRNPIARE